jgi:hypothetical protein
LHSFALALKDLINCVAKRVVHLGKPPI